MNIGIVTTWFERGAAYVSRLYRDALACKHRVYIYARGGEDYAVGDPNWNQIGVTWGKKIPVAIPMAIDYKCFKDWIQRNNIEIVFFNEQQWWEPVLWCKDLNVKSGAYVDYYTEDTIPLFKNYDFLICNTLRHYNLFKNHPQAFYIPWGTNISLFTPKTFHAVRENTITFFHSAGMSPCRKGTDLVIQAFTQLQGDCRLIIHSQQRLKEYFPELKELIVSLESSRKLKIYEGTISAPGLYHLGDVYVYPSRLDGIGLTVAEALACGLPAIVTDSPPMNEFINTTNGKLVKVSQSFARSDGYYWPQCLVDINDLVECMQSYVNNYAEISGYKISARNYAQRYLDWFQNSSNLSNLFENIKWIDRSELVEASSKVKEFERKRLRGLDSLYFSQPALHRIIYFFLMMTRNLKHRLI